jgi:branched-subunit amino acid ABC-type transport system permease component
VAVTFLTAIVPQLAFILTFAVMAAVLLIRPHGLFGLRTT